MSVPNVGKSHYRQGGTRGGADQFNWNDVKDEKYRENYLGHSLKAPVGRWCKDRDLTWWDKGKRTTTASLAEEEAKKEKIRLRDALKKQEDELMAQALGLAPHRNYTTTTQLDSHDLKLIAQRETDTVNDALEDRVSGLGASSNVKHHDFVPESQRNNRDKVDSVVGSATAAFANAKNSSQGKVESSSAVNLDSGVDRIQKSEGVPSNQKRERKLLHSGTEGDSSSSEDERDKLISALKSQLAKDKFLKSRDLDSTLPNNQRRKRRHRSKERRKKSKKHRKRKKEHKRQRSRSESVSPEKSERGTNRRHRSNERDKSSRRTRDWQSRGRSTDKREPKRHRSREPRSRKRRFDRRRSRSM